MKERLVILISLLLLFVAFFAFKTNLSVGDLTGLVVMGGRAESVNKMPTDSERFWMYTSKDIIRRSEGTVVYFNSGKYCMRPLVLFAKADGSYKKTYQICDGTACCGKKRLPIEVSRSLLPGTYVLSARDMKEEILSHEFTVV